MSLKSNNAKIPVEDTIILELAICVTNSKYEPLDEGLSLLVHRPDLTAAQLHDLMPKVYVLLKAFLHELTSLLRAQDMYNKVSLFLSS